MITVTKDQLEMSILSKVRASIDDNESLKANPRLISAVASNDALEAARELTVMARDITQVRLRRKFVSPLSERNRDPFGETVLEALRKINAEISQLLDFIAPSDVA